MITLRELLEQMVAKKASDLHLTAGVPPEFRIDGSIIPGDMEPLAPEVTAQLAYSMLSDEQRKRFETCRSESRACRGSGRTSTCSAVASRPRSARSRSRSGRSNRSACRRS